MVTLMQIGERAIRDTVARVFSTPEYNASSPFAPVRRWLGDHLRQLLAWLAHLFPSRADSPALFWITVATLGALALGGVGTVAWRWWRHRAIRPAGGGRETAPPAAAHVDPWRTAQRLAADGAFTDAAHALYQALLDGAAREGEVRIHPSKTAGDYVRELRDRSSTLLNQFRAFARSYEVVVYGLEGCDAERYEQLRGLALNVRRPHD